MNTQMFFAVNSKGMSHKSQKLRTHEVDEDDDELEDEIDDDEVDEDELDDSEIDEDDDEFLDNEEEDEEELSAFRQRLMRLERKHLKANRQPPLEIMDMTFAKPVKTPQKKMTVHRHDDGKTLNNPAWEF